MKLLRQFLVVLIILFTGEFLNRFFHLPVPGNVIGMLILFLCLITGLIKVEFLEEITSFLLDHLAFFFIPAGVGMITNFHMLKGQWPMILAIIGITTVIVMVVTSLTIELMNKGRA